MKTAVKTIALALLLSLLPRVGFTQTQAPHLTLSAEETRQLNTFFSNFSEALMEPFTRDNQDDKNLIDFAILHNYINNYARFERGRAEHQVKIKASYIDETTRRFFGKTIPHPQPDPDRGIEYHEGWYHCTDASGEAYYFSQVASLSDQGKGLYTATIKVYVAGSGWTGDVHGTEADWKKADPEDVPQVAEVMQATLRKITDQGKSRYILLDYVKMD
jgi:hypothetical protein